MPIFSKLAIGDILQFPSGALKKLTKIQDTSLIFSTLKNGKKRMTYTIDFVLAFCDLMPKDVDAQYFLNTSHLRKIIDVKSKPVLDYDNSRVLAGYFIEDEMIDPPPEEDPD